MKKIVLISFVLLFAACSNPYSQEENSSVSGVRSTLGTITNVQHTESIDPQFQLKLITTTFDPYPGAAWYEVLYLTNPLSDVAMVRRIEASEDLSITLPYYMGGENIINIKAYDANGNLIAALYEPWFPVP